MNIQIGQIVAQIISFLIMYWILKRYAWKPILKVMADRRDKIKAEFDAIDLEKKEILNLMNEYQEKLNEVDVEARVIVQEAIEKANQKAQEIQQKAQEQAKAIIHKARIDAENEMKKAKSQLKKELVDMTLSATEKALQTSVNEEKQKDIVLDLIKHVGLN